MLANSEGTQNFHKFSGSLKASVLALTGDDGTVNMGKYLQSDAYRDYPPAEAMLRVRRQVSELREKAMKDLESINTMRSRAGLPPIVSPFENSDDKNQVVEGETELRDGNAGNGPENKEPDRNRSFEDDSVVGDVPIHERILRLIHPDSIPGLSQHGKDQRREMVMDERRAGERLRDRLEEGINQALHRQTTPDFTLSSGEWTKIRGYLISHINPQFSEISTTDYNVLPALPFKEARGLARLRFNRTIKPGLNTLLCPPGYRPVSYFHSQPVELMVSGIPEKNVYAFKLDKDIPGGLTFYFEKSELTDNSSPDAKEISEIADFDNLADHWKGLLVAIRSSGLSDKQKVDVLLRAWTKSFNYDDSQETFDLYEESRQMPKAFATQIINEAAGNCGYVCRGFHGLLSLVGISSRDIASFLSDGFGKYNQRGNYHALNQAYLDGKWVYIEPQAGYLQAGYQIEDVPGELRVEFNTLLATIPESQSKSPRQLEGLPPILSSEMPSIPSIAESVVDLIATSIPGSIPNPLDYLRLIASSIDLYGAHGNSSQVKKEPGELVRGAVKYGIPTAVTAFIVERAASYLRERHVSAVDFTPIVDLAHKVPPELIITAVLLGASFYGGRLYERHKSKTGVQSQIPIVEEDSTEISETN